MDGILGLAGDRRVSVLFVGCDWDASLERAEALVRKGWRVRLSASAEDALGTLEGTLPDVILTDLVLRGAMSGLDLARHVRHDGRTRYVPVIALTARPLEEVERAASEAGCSSCLVNRCSVDALSDALTSAVAMSDLLGFQRARRKARLGDEAPRSASAGRSK